MLYNMLMVCAISASFTDVRLSAIADIGDSRTSGYQLPFMGVGIGVDIQTKRMLFQGSALQSWTDKYYYGDISQFYSTGRVLLNFEGFALGGGMTYTHLTFGDLGVTRDSWRPVMSAGYLDRRRLVLLEYRFSGWDPAYLVQDISLVVETEVVRHVRFASDITYRRFRNRTDTYRDRGFQFDVFLKFVR